MIQDLYESCVGSEIVKVTLVDFVNEYNVKHQCHWTEVQKISIIVELEYQIRMTLFKYLNQSKII